MLHNVMDYCVSEEIRSHLIHIHPELAGRKGEILFTQPLSFSVQLID